MPDPTISIEQTGIADVTILQQLTIGTVPVQIPYFNCKEILIKADPTNTAYISVQMGSNQATQNSFPISPNGALRIATNQSDKYWIVSTASSQLAYVASAKGKLAYSSGSIIGGSGGGVTQLVAGTGITLSPAGGTGVVTVTASGAGVASLNSETGALTLGSTLGTIAVTNSGAAFNIDVNVDGTTLVVNGSGQVSLNIATAQNIWTLRQDFTNGIGTVTLKGWSDHYQYVTYTDGVGNVYIGDYGSHYSGVYLSVLQTGTVSTVLASMNVPTGYTYLINGTSVFATANAWTAVQTFNNSDVRLKGSSTGYTTFTSANASGTNYTATFPANTGTVAELNLAQSFTAAQTFAAITTTAGIASGANVASLSGTYTVLSTDEVMIFTTGATTYAVDLPAASANTGRKLLIIKADSGAGALTITPAGSDTIEGAATKSLTTQYNKIGLVSDGVSVWYDLGTGGGI